MSFVKTLSNKHIKLTFYLAPFMLILYPIGYLMGTLWYSFYAGWCTIEHNVYQLGDKYNKYHEGDE